MALRDKLRTNATPLLQPGETIQSIFSAQTVSAYWSLLSYWIVIFKNAYRVVIVTDRRIVVANSGRFRITPVKDIRAQFPRATRIGPASGLWFKTEVLGEKLYIHKRFHKDIAAADAAAPQGYGQGYGQPSSFAPPPSAFGPPPSAFGPPSQPYPPYAPPAGDAGFGQATYNQPVQPGGYDPAYDPEISQPTIIRPLPPKQQ